jgi:hypothetical protein
VSDQEVFS